MQVKKETVRIISLVLIVLSIMVVVVIFSWINIAQHRSKRIKAQKVKECMKKCFGVGPTKEMLEVQMRENCIEFCKATPEAFLERYYSNSEK